VKRRTSQILTCFGLLLVAARPDSPAAYSNEGSPPPSSSAPKPPRDLARRIGEITDAVLTYHIDPPPRQQMVLSAIKALYKASGGPVPPGLGRRVSALTTPDQLASLIVEIWPKSQSKPINDKPLEEALLEGLLDDVSGEAALISEKDRVVMEQTEGNRYVGIHIALGMDNEEKRPKISTVIEGGPAERAGVKDDDLIELIDGMDTKDMVLREAVDRLRGQEGTEVTIKVRQPKATNSRTYKIMRGQHARSTVQGIRKRSTGVWDCRVDGTSAIAYLRINEITASTPHDLRKLAAQVESQGNQAVVIDLRSVAGTSIHPAVMLADTLLAAGVIGRMQTAERQVTYQADSDAMFRSLPIAVLVDQYTSGTAEWIAAALQDNQRAIIVGRPTFSAMIRIQGAISRGSDVRTRVSLGDGSGAIELATGRLERGDGRRISGDPSPDRQIAPVSSPKITNPNEVTFGVKPDHVVGQAGDSPRQSTPFRPGRKPAQKLDSATDEVLDEAVRLLRQLLQKII
jgi:carboxyl-terminal processing protease